MRALDINKENLDNQIGTVSEERGRASTNQPYGRTSRSSRAWPTGTPPTGTR